MADRKRPLNAVLILPVILVIVGFAGLNRVMQSPNFAMYRTVDVVQFLGSGLCFGVAMVLIIIVLRGVRI
jgi:hypothetical protein